MFWIIQKIFSFLLYCFINFCQSPLELSITENRKMFSSFQENQFKQIINNIKKDFNSLKKEDFLRKKTKNEFLKKKILFKIRNI